MTADSSFRADDCASKSPQKSCSAIESFVQDLYKPPTDFGSSSIAPLGPRDRLSNPTLLNFDPAADDKSTDSRVRVASLSFPPLSGFDPASGRFKAADEAAPMRRDINNGPYLDIPPISRAYDRSARADATTVVPAADAKSKETAEKLSRLLDNGTSDEQKLQLIQNLAREGITSIKGADQNGRPLTMRLETQNAGRREMVHLFIAGEDGKERTVLRGIARADGSFEKQRDKSGSFVDYRGKGFALFEGAEAQSLSIGAQREAAPVVDGPDGRGSRLRRAAPPDGGERFQSRRNRRSRVPDDGDAGPRNGEFPALNDGGLRVISSHRARATAYFPHNSKMEGGFKDRKGRPLNTLQAYLRGEAPYVSVAMDAKVAPYGTRIRIPELEQKYGRPIEFRLVDTGGAFRGRGTSRIDICVENRKQTYDPSFNSNLTVHFVEGGTAMRRRGEPDGTPQLRERNRQITDRPPYRTQWPRTEEQQEVAERYRYHSERGARPPEDRTLMGGVSRLAHRLADEAHRVAREMGSTGWCARGVQRALARLGMTEFLGSGNAWQMRHAIERSGKFVEIPLSQVQRGDVVVQRWTGNNRGAGDIFIALGRDSSGQLIQANDHVQKFNPRSGRYDIRKAYRLVV